MLIFPAIDLRGGQCVRLRQGDYAQETVFSDDPASMARHWVSHGARYLHLVDLDGAREGRPVNGAAIQRVVATAGVPCQLGGGLRTQDAIETALGWGVKRVILGTRAFQDPDWLGETCHRFPNQVVLGIDAWNGKVATEGWLKVSELSALELAKRCTSWPLAALIYTDISRDGMLTGPNFEAMAEMTAAVALPVIASGGVGSIEDVRRLASLGLPGCIIGRALYEGRFDLETLFKEFGNSEELARAL